MLDKGFEHITLETGDGIKEISIEDIQKKNFSKRWYSIRAIMMEREKGNFQGIIIIGKNALAFYTNIDISVVNTLIKDKGLEIIRELTLNLKKKLNEITSKLGLEWKGVVNKPILYKKCECSLKNVKEFVNKLEIFSKEFPLYWV